MCSQPKGFSEFVKKVSRFCVVVLLLGVPSRARALDTTESFEPGLSDAEIYIGIDGIPYGGDASRSNAATVLGYGILPRLSGWVGLAFDVGLTLDDPASELAFGTFGTPLSFKHFEMDLFLDFALAGASLDTFAIRPAVELNINADAQMRSWGLFITAAAPMTAAEDSGPIDVALTGRAGAYFRVHPRHELLLGYQAAYHTLVTPGVHRLELRDVALGYNVLLTDNLELISDVHLDIPQANERWGTGGYIGLVASLPSAAK